MLSRLIWRLANRYCKEQLGTLQRVLATQAMKFEREECLTRLRLAYKRIPDHGRHAREQLAAVIQELAPKVKDVRIVQHQEKDTGNNAVVEAYRENAGAAGIGVDRGTEGAEAGRDKSADDRDPGRERPQGQH